MEEFEQRLGPLGSCWARPGLGYMEEAGDGTEYGGDDGDD